KSTARNEETKTVNLSRGGASFTGKGPFRSGMKLGITFVGASNLREKVRELPAKVVRVSRSKAARESVIAVRFEDAGLANLVLTEMLRAQMRVSVALLEIIQALSPGAEVEEVIEKIQRATERALEAEKALLFSRGDKHGLLSARGRNKHEF